MLKSIKMDYYRDGYKGVQINCIDYPIAGAAGCYNYDNYYFYGFYYSVLKNWSNFEDDFVIFRNNILNKFGLNLKINIFNDDTQLINLIKDNIDNLCPVIMMVSYHALPFLGSYLIDTSKMGHAFIITDYDSDRKIFIIREFALNGEVTKNIFKGDPFFKLQITEEQLINIWIRSKEIYKENVFYSIEKVSELTINNYNDLIEDFICNYSYTKSKLLNSICDFNKQYDLIKCNLNAVEVESYRRLYHGSIHILFDVIEKAFSFLKEDREKHKNFYEFRDQYIRFRYLLISKLHAQALRGKPFNESKINKITDDIRSMDSELFSLVSKLYSFSKQELKVQLPGNTVKKLKNYAFKAKVTVDSEYNPNTEVHYKASQAVDGKWNIPANDMWISTNKRSTHWLKVDLDQPRTVNKFVLRHYDIPGYITVDFKIQGGHDGKKWRNLVIVANNNSGITTHEVSPSTYRYFRLYITYPATYDFRARIYEFEIWGI